MLKGRAQPFTVKDPQRYVELTGAVPVYKLHGSLNWGRGTGGLELCQDMHPAFISGGNAAIVPPVTEKERPHWLRSVWEGAERALARSRCWIVCGYSLPSYDMGMRDALRTASGGELERVFILDPRSKVLRDDYKEVVGDTSVCCLAGLPRGIEELRMAVGADRGAVFPDAQPG